MLAGESFHLCILVTLGGCGGNSFQPLPYELPDPASVHVAVPDGPYFPGSRIPISVLNEGNEEYIWNPCFRSLDRRRGLTWVRVDEGDRICTAEGWILAPGQRTNAATDIPRSLQPGSTGSSTALAHIEAVAAAQDLLNLGIGLSAAERGRNFDEAGSGTGSPSCWANKPTISSAMSALGLGRCRGTSPRTGRRRCHHRRQGSALTERLDVADSGMYGEPHRAKLRAPASHRKAAAGRARRSGRCRMHRSDASPRQRR
jgi:hypothetical protein